MSKKFEEMPEEIKRRVVTLLDEESDREITVSAQLEAMMTVLKIKTEHENPNRIIVPESCVGDKDRLFHFARIYQGSLLAIYTGKMTIPADVLKIFDLTHEDALRLGLGVPVDPHSKNTIPFYKPKDDGH